MEITVIYQDLDILILNKPAGVVVNRAESVSVPTVQDWLEHFWGAVQPVFPENWKELLPSDFSTEYGTPEEIFAQRSGIAHRIDKQTSGILLVALHPAALVSLLRQFREREVHKTYRCLVHGSLSTETGEISAPLGRRSGNRKLFGVVADGRPAVTTYAVEQTYLGLTELALSQYPDLKQKRTTLYEGFSLVRCHPKTGRTHQIRVHMAHLHHPIVGDSAYVGKKRAKIDVLWCPRQFLHAAQIEFTHPRSNELVQFECPLTADLEAVLTYLKK